MRSESIFKILTELGLDVTEGTEKIIRVLDKNEIINENDLADDLGVKINDIRKALYKLGRLGFVTYSKEKDVNKKWWYVYNWQLDKAKIHYKYIQHLRGILHTKERMLLDEQKYEFQCRKCKKKYTYEEAMEYDFICRSDSCSGVVRQVTNSRLISQLTKDIMELLETIKVEDEIARKNKEAQMKARQELLDKEKAAEDKAKAEVLALRRVAAAKKRAEKKAAADKLKPKKLVKKKVVKKKASAKKASVKKKMVKKSPTRKIAKRPTIKKNVVKKKLAKRAVKRATRKITKKRR
jgi:transcription initiation factor TFIIE subunit alpha